MKSNNHYEIYYHILKIGNLEIITSQTLIYNIKILFFFRRNMIIYQFILYQFDYHLKHKLNSEI